MSLRDAVSKSYDDKLGRMGLKIRTAEMGEDEGEGHVLAATDGSQGMASGSRAKGYEAKRPMSARWLTRPQNSASTAPGYKKGGRVRRHHGQRDRRWWWPKPRWLLPDAGRSPPPPPMPGPGPGAGAAMPPPMMGRKNGGKVPT